MSEPSDPRSEPEIIPPGAPSRRGPEIWVSGDTRQTHYVYTTRVGPVGFALMTLAGGVVAALALLLLLGAAFVGLAAIGVFTIAAIIAGILRKPR